MVIAYNSSSTSMEVRWSHLPVENFRGRPIGYNITYYPVDLESYFRVLSVEYPKNTTTLTNLTVYTMYVIHVSAVSSGGIGPANTVKARTEADGKEDFLRDITCNMRSIITLSISLRNAIKIFYGKCFRFDNFNPPYRFI